MGKGGGGRWPRALCLAKIRGRRLPCKQAQGKRHGRKRQTVARRAPKQSLVERYPDLKDSSVPDFILSESKYIIEALTADGQGFSARATALIGFAGTVAAVIAAMHTFIPAWAQVASGLVLFASIALSGVALFLVPIDFPTLDDYPTYENAVDPSNKARIGLELAKAYQDFICDLMALLGKKARFLQYSLICFVGAVAMLFVSIIIQAICQSHSAGT